MHAIASDDCGSVVDAAAGIDQAYSFVVDVDTHDARRGMDVHVRGERNLLVQRLVDIGAVNDGVRVMETAAKGFANGDARDFAAVDRVHHDEIVGEYRPPTRTLADPERIHSCKTVGTELKPGADLADLRRLLEDFDAESLLLERERRGHPADATANDEHRRRSVSIAAHGVASAPLVNTELAL